MTIIQNGRFTLYIDGRPFGEMLGSASTREEELKIGDGEVLRVPATATLTVVSTIRGKKAKSLWRFVRHHMRMLEPDRRTKKAIAAIRSSRRRALVKAAGNATLSREEKQARKQDVLSLWPKFPVSIPRSLR